MPLHAPPLPRYGVTEYSINFKSMQQTNLSNYCVRKVRRQETRQASSSGGGLEAEHAEIDKGCPT